MRGIKNFFHDINDIVLALVIVVVAAGIIFWRMQVIMKYPQEMAKHNAVQVEQQDEAKSSSASDKVADDADKTAADKTANDKDEKPKG